MKQYAMYLRKSRADQDETITETLRRHKETLLEYAVKNDLSIAQQDIYEEVVSGESLYARPQMLKLLEQVSNGMYTGILCMDIDRLGRGGMSDQGIILESFKQSNTQILTPSKVYDLNDENDENNLEFKAFFARFEYKQIRKRMLAGTERAVREGAYLIPAPFGYRNTTINKKPSLEIYEPEAKFVRMIFDMYANQGMGCSQITYAINATGIKTRRDDTFNKVGILRILKNPVYIGKVRWHKNKALEKQIITDGLHQPIIDIETWNKTQEILTVRYKPPCVNRGMKNSLAGLVYCKNCGGLMKRLPPNKARKTPISRINCEKKGCMTGTRFEYLENAVIKYLQEKLDNLDYEYGTKNTPKENYSEQINILSSSLKEVEKQNNKLHDLLEREIYDIDTFLNRQKILHSRKEKLKTQINELETKQQSCRVIDIETMRKNINNVLEFYWDSPPTSRNTLLRGVLDKVIYYKEKEWGPAEFEIELVLKQVYF